MHKVASKACMNRLAIFKAVLAKQSIFFSQILFQAEPKLSLHQTRWKHVSLPKQKLSEITKNELLPSKSCHCHNKTFHSIASSIKNERNLLPYWSGSAVLKEKQLLHKIQIERGGRRRSCKVRVL